MIILKENVCYLSEEYTGIPKAFSSISGFYQRSTQVHFHIFFLNIYRDVTTINGCTSDILDQCFGTSDLQNTRDPQEVARDDSRKGDVYLKNICLVLYSLLYYQRRAYCQEILGCYNKGIKLLLFRIIIIIENFRRNVKLISILV